MKRVWSIAIVLMISLFLGPLLWAVVEAAGVSMNGDIDVADHTAMELSDLSSQARNSDRTIFDPHVYDAETVAKDCKVPWEPLKSIDFNDAAAKLPWSPGKGWSRFTVQSIYMDNDEQRSLDVAALKKQTSVFERAFLTRCIASSVARPACLSRVRSITGVNRPNDDPKEKNIYITARAMQHENACRFLRGLAAENTTVSTP